MAVQVIGDIAGIEVIAAGKAVRDRDRLRRVYGRGRWRKLKGTAVVVLPDRTLVRAEVHWYEAHGRGRRELKVKRLLD